MKPPDAAKPPLRYKKLRLGPEIVRLAESGFHTQTHVIFGGTGAVGGATAIQMVSIFEEALALRPETGGEGPRIVVTGRTGKERRLFTRLLFSVHQREHGADPERLPGIGYRTAGGVTVELRPFSVNPTLSRPATGSRKPDADGSALRELLLARGLSADLSEEEKARGLHALLEELVGGAFTGFHEDCCLDGGAARVRSVIVAIPLATIAAYQPSALKEAARVLEADLSGELEEALKETYLRALRDDLARARESLTDEVLIAHTTAVGGMFDEMRGGGRRIRMGFAHRPLDSALPDKMRFAEKLVELYAEAGLKVLITAAAIGVDAILMRQSPPLNGDVRRKLQEARHAGFAVMARGDRNLRYFLPVDLDLLDEPDEPIAFERRREMIFEYLLRSGENGYFSVSNTEALYRVMRVTSSSELGLLLARTAILGDEEDSPAFPANRCYYTETDYSRQVFDLLAQPLLQRVQVSGLQPKALQDLGSAKHQAELHLLGLLILLHRLKTLDLDAIPRHPNLGIFDPAAFFEEHSTVLTLERAASWRAEELEPELEILATARSEEDLRPLKSFPFQADPDRQQAAHRVFQEVLHAVWAVPSIGTPLLYRRDGRRRVASGNYAASIDRAVTHRDTFARFLRRRFEAVGGGDDDAFHRFVEFHVAQNGFADLRSVAVLVTATTDEEDLDGKVRVYEAEEEFVAALAGLPPYSSFTTSGLIALLVRLKGLCKAALQLDFSLGTANEFRASFPHDERDRPLLVPGVVEAFRMVSEGLEKNTGLERIDGRWGYYIDL